MAGHTNYCCHRVINVKIFLKNIKSNILILPNILKIILNEKNFKKESKKLQFDDLDR